MANNQAQILNKYSTMKHLTAKTKFLQRQIFEWVLFKGPELFITIYGK